MNLTKTAALLLAAIALACAASADDDEKKENTKPGCGNSNSIRTAIKIVRDEYFSSDEERKLELVGIRTTARDKELDSYSCSASVQFVVMNGDVIRKGDFWPG